MDATAIWNQASKIPEKAAHRMQSENLVRWYGGLIVFSLRSWQCTANRNFGRARCVHDHVITFNCQVQKNHGYAWDIEVCQFDL